VYVCLPGCQNGSGDTPSNFYQDVKKKLESIGLGAPTWSYRYNGGANPIAFAIPLDKATHSVMRDMLRSAYDLA
jgi:hypothetical protein